MLTILVTVAFVCPLYFLYQFRHDPYLHQGLQDDRLLFFLPSLAVPAVTVFLLLICSKDYLAEMLFSSWCWFQDDVIATAVSVFCIGCFFKSESLKLRVLCIVPVLLLMLVLFIANIRLS